MTKVVLSHVGSLIEATTAKATINADMDAIETAFDNTLSRDGSAPNQMEASIDMNSNRILNLAAPISDGEPVRLEDIQDIIVAQLPTALNSNVYETVASAVLTNISASVKSIQTAGFYTAGDGGGATYYHASGTTAGGFQSADGQWWQLINTGQPHVKQYGAKGDGVSSDLLAFQNALTPWAATVPGTGLGYNLEVPQGVYVIPSTLDIFTSNSECKFIGRGRPILQNTGAGTGFNASNPVGFGPTGPHLENLSFWGNANTPIILYLNNQTRLNWKNLHFKNASTTGTAFRVDFCILSKFSHITHNQGDTSIPLIGVQVGTGTLGTTGVTASIFENIIMEGVGTGIDVVNANTVIFTGGVSESNVSGVHIGPASVNVTFESFDCEANSSSDWFVEGTGCNLNNCSGGSAGGTNIAGRNNRITGGFFTNIIGASGTHNVYDGVRYSGTFTPSATDKYRNMFNTTTSTYIADSWT